MLTIRSSNHGRVDNEKESIFEASLQYKLNTTAYLGMRAALIPECILI